MNAATAVTLLVGLGSVVITAGTTIWHRRRRGPEASAAMVTASTLLLEQLQRRGSALEAQTVDQGIRIKMLEDENAEQGNTIERYRLLFGPLPPINYFPEWPENSEPTEGEKEI